MAPEIIEGNRYNGKVDVFPLFQSGEMSLFILNKKVVDENYRPKFEFLIKPSIQKLIESCWAKDPKKRPTFKEIFKKLAYNIDDDVNDNDVNNEENYYLEDVDVNEVIAYANDIDDSNQLNKEEKDNEKSINDLIEKLINPIIRANEEFKKELTELRSENEKIKNENVKTMNENVEI